MEMLNENGTYEEPFWGDENGCVTCYMCYTAFVEDMGNTDVTLYPTLESLQKGKSCVKECGAVEVLVFESEAGKLFIERMAFDHELGRSVCKVYHTLTTIMRKDLYAQKYGTRRIEVVLQRQVVPPMPIEEVIKNAKARKDRQWGSNGLRSRGSGSRKGDGPRDRRMGT